jgi:hypothetical protein
MADAWRELGFPSNGTKIHIPKWVIDRRPRAMSAIWTVLGADTQHRIELSRGIRFSVGGGICQSFSDARWRDLSPARRSRAITATI